MKKVLLFLFIATSYLGMSAQKDMAKVDNYTIMRLIIINDKGEMLLEKFRNERWLTPALRHNKQESVRESLDSLANRMGIKISSPSLAGLFTYKFKAKKTVSFRQHYTAKYIQGKLTPKDPKSLQWFPVEVAMQKIGEASKPLKLMMDKMMSSPEVLWGGSIYLYKEDGEYKNKILEDFYILRDENNLTIKKAKK